MSLKQTENSVMTSLSIKNMSIEQKLSTMELIWDDLCHNDQVSSPDWHLDVLKTREKNKETSINWSTAKQQIISKTR